MVRVAAENRAFTGGGEHNCIKDGYQGARTMGKGVVAFALLLGTGAVLVLNTSYHQRESETKAANAAADAEAAKAAEIKRCSDNRQLLVDEAKKLAKAGKAWDAHMTLHLCVASLAGDAEFAQLSLSYEIADNVRSLKDPKQTTTGKLASARRIRELDPEAFKSYAATLDRLELQEAREIAAEKRKRGVTVGMTKDDVLASSWGRPESINKSVYSHGTHEQWIYGNGHYLYFEGNQLTSIQTSRR